VDDLSVEREQSEIIIGYLREAVKIISMDSFKDGYVWRPSDVHYAKLIYRQAQFFKRPGSFGKVMALRCINGALDLIPDDPVLLKERESILAL
jgi:hypothetical protein